MNYQFGSADFDPSTGEVRTDTGTTRLSTKAAVLLEALVVRQGEVLTRDEIRDLLWPGGRVEFDQGINFLIRTIRRALDESARSPRFIETLPKRGYRFIAPVSRVETTRARDARHPLPTPDGPADAAVPDPAVDAGPRPAPSIPDGPKARRTLPWLLGAAISAVLAFTLSVPLPRGRLRMLRRALLRPPCPCWPSSPSQTGTRIRLPRRRHERCSRR